MGFVGSMRVKLGAEIRGFRSKMGKAGGVTAKFRSKIGGLGKSLTGLMPALAGVASIAGIGAMIKGQMAAIDSTAKLSDQLGVLTEDLIKLRHAAELTGAGSKSLDAGLATMAKRLGEAARGSGAAAPALAELGLEAKVLVAMRPDQAFREIAGALEKIEEPARRNAIAANLFSKANMGLLNTLAAGKDGLKAMGDEAERLGMTFSRVDAAKVEAANDALTKMGAVSKTIFRDAAISLGPYITLVGEDLVKAYADAGKAAEDAGKKMEVSTKDTRSGMDDFADVLHTVRMGWRMLNSDPNKDWGAILGELTPSERKARMVREQEKKIQGNIARKAAAAQAKLTAAGVLGAGKGLVQPGVEMAGNFLKNAQQLAGKLQGPLDKLVQFDKQMGKTIRDLNTDLSATFNKGVEFAKTLRTPLEQLGVDLADLEKFLGVGAISPEVHRRGVKAAFDKADLGERDDPTLQFSAALKRGSAAARSAILQTQAESPEVKATKESNRLLRNIDENLSKTQKPRIVSFAGGAIA